MKQFCIIGNPVEHSISPRLHNLAYKCLGVAANYSRLKLENAKDFREKFFTCKYDGANITVPYKEVAFANCDEVFGIAKQIEAVNTVVKRGDKLFGYNTDAPGFIKSIEEFKNIKNVLMLGAGGTAKALSFALRENGLHVNILNRSKNRLDFFNGANFNTFSHDENLPNSFDLLINTTSAGLKDNELPAPKELLLGLIKNAKYAVDVIYNKETPFIKLCKETSLTCKDGSDMLLYQAVFAFNIFFDNRFNEEDITKAMRGAFTL
ncbi:MAG: shikimate dehydrogenase [Campylobacteraceae bacterium]